MSPKKTKVEHAILFFYNLATQKLCINGSLWIHDESHDKCLFTNDQIEVAILYNPVRKCLRLTTGAVGQVLA